jgi:hypothetical protein
VATLCENGGTLDVMVKLEDTFVLLIVSHLVFEANRMKVSKIQHKFWHTTMAKLRDLPTHSTIDRINVIHEVMVMHNEKGMFELRGALTCQYQPHRVLLDSGVQPLMSGKAVVDGFGLTDVDFDPCSYQILAFMGGSKKARRLTK